MSAKRVAITIDDLPYTSSGNPSINEVEYTVSLLLSALGSIPSIGFINGKKLETSDFERLLTLTKQWLDKGHIL